MSGYLETFRARKWCSRIDCFLEKQLDRIENALSAAADDGCTHNVVLHADAQFSSVSSCFLDHSNLSPSGETSSDVARYAGSSFFSPFIAT